MMPYSSSIIRRRQRRRRRGFTLVELLIVVLVIGALLAIALPLYQNAVKSANLGVAKANLRSMFNASQMYRARTGSYPTAVATITAELGQTMDQHPTNVTYTFSVNGSTGAMTLSANDGSIGNSVLGIANETYVWNPGDSVGTFSP